MHPCSASFSAKELAAITKGTWTRTPKSKLASFYYDTRNAPQQGTFLALKGPRRNGQAFLEEAENQGAKAALVTQAQPNLALPQLVVEDPLAALQMLAKHHRKSFKGKVVGISGSHGKSSTKDALDHLLCPHFKVFSTPKNLNSQLGVPLSLLAVKAQEHEIIIIEAGIDAPGQMEILEAMIQPHYVVMTHLAPVHLKALRNLHRIALEKSKLIGSLTHSLICPRSCLNFAGFAQSSEQLETWTVELPSKLFQLKDEALRVHLCLPANQPPHSTHSVDFSHTCDNLTLRDSSGEQSYTVYFKASEGAFHNLALALVAAKALGLSLSADSLAGYTPPQLRHQWHLGEKQQIYLDCYNANPMAMLDAIDTVTEQEGRKLYILAAMKGLGERSDNWHSFVARHIPPRLGDEIALVGQEAHAYTSGLIAGAWRKEAIHFYDCAEAVKPHLKAFEGTVLIKGSRFYQLESLLVP